MPENSEMIILHPQEHLSLKKQTLDNELSKLKLIEEEIENIRDGHAIKVLDDKILGKIPGYSLSKTLLVWNKEVNNEIKNAKKEMLLVNCCSRISKVISPADAVFQ